MKHIVTYLVLLCACLLTTGAVAQEKGIGKTFPAFKVTSMDGQKFSSKEMVGKVTLVNFWFEQCKPCVAEFKSLNALYERFKDDPRFCFLSFTFDPPASVNESITRHRLLFPVCAVSMDECMKLNLRSSYPTNIIIGTDGKIVFFKTGGKIAQDDVADEVKEFEEIIATLLVEADKGADPSISQ